jgi:hypothetical protein
MSISALRRPWPGGDGQVYAGRMPSASPRRLPKTTRLRALELLADCDPEGCSGALLLANGVTIEQLDELVRARLVSATPHQVRAGRDRMAVATLRITEAGRRSLDEAMNLLLDPDAIYFPDPEAIAPLAIAFARLMFAHAKFEGEFRSLQGAITNDPRFGERRANQWSARRRPDCMAKLIEKHFPDGLEEAEPIAKLLNDAIDLCDRRNLLAHGEWWYFHQPTSTVTVRSGTQGRDDEGPEHADFTAAGIYALAEKFKDLAAELYHLGHSIDARKSCPS